MGSVVAYYSGQTPPPPPPNAGVMNVVSVGKDETLMPTYSIALLVVGPGQQYTSCHVITCHFTLNMRVTLLRRDTLQDDARV